MFLYYYTKKGRFEVNPPRDIPWQELHWEDGPAIMGTQYSIWFINGRRHREDGPAVIYHNGSTEYWLYGKYLTEEEFNEVPDELRRKLIWGGK
jgi:hypothetical protein